MPIEPQMIFKVAAGLYALSLASTFIFDQRPQVSRLLLVPALMANAAVVAWRYWTAWPMLPMYLGPVALPLVLGALAAFLGNASGPDRQRVRRAILILTVIVCLAAMLFPKDYYIPFIKSQTPAAHLFFWFGIAGRGCLLVAAAWAMAGLIVRNGESERGGSGEGQFPPSVSVSPDLPLSDSPHPPVSPSSLSMRWTVWGFAFWTLSMFSGELWSYLGWGTPVVWDEPAITTTMATWFFYVCLMHLHLTGTWTARGRCAYAAAGALVVLGLSVVPELGPLRWPV